EAAPLPEPVQAGRGPAVQLLHALPPVPLRGAQLGGAGGRLRRRRARPARGPARGRGRHREAGPQGRPHPGRPGRLRHLRRGGVHRGHPRGEPAADGRGRGLRPQARRGEGRGAHLRRRHPPARAAGRPAARGAGEALLLTRSTDRAGLPRCGPARRRPEGRSQAAMPTRLADTAWSTLKRPAPTAASTSATAPITPTSSQPPSVTITPLPTWTSTAAPIMSSTTRTPTSAVAAPRRISAPPTSSTRPA